jgi:hypothetical protein
MRTINDPTMDDLLFIGSWMCDSDRVEMALTRDPADYVQLAKDAWESQFKFVVLDNGFPVMAFGAKPIEGTALVWGFKTDKGWSSISTVTKFLRRVMIPALKDIGVRRAICLVHPDNRASQRWLTHLGFSPKATFTGFGSRKEDVLLFQRDEQEPLVSH